MTFSRQLNYLGWNLHSSIFTRRHGQYSIGCLGMELGGNCAILDRKSGQHVQAKPGRIDCILKSSSLVLNRQPMLKSQPGWLRSGRNFKWFTKPSFSTGWKWSIDVQCCCTEFQLITLLHIVCQHFAQIFGLPTEIKSAEIVWLRLATSFTVLARPWILFHIIPKFQTVWHGTTSSEPTKHWLHDYVHIL